MGKGKNSLLHILSVSGLSRLTVPAVRTDTQTHLELWVVRGGRWSCGGWGGAHSQGLSKAGEGGPGWWHHSTYCKTCTVHFMDNIFQDKELLVETMTSARPGKVFSLDCEWVYTERGGELARVTLLPPCPVLDYNTRFSGITTEHNIMKVTTSLRQVQDTLLNITDSKDIKQYSIYGSES